ncbi:TonB-dependent receptor [Microbulbifer litoralis]|uniref:TonB-dependent receptor n=1 Tax=Microbulbifer litoralis TaxID=2933965 RepID=UPI0020298B11|nr:TonB-dependent receptor [Microbulbifer sp. GX H0434]
MKTTYPQTAVSQAALMFALGVATPAALAQDDQGDDATASLEEITVTGSYQSSLRSALDQKRDASGIIEAISADDIGQLPDISITESLARLPGLAQDRDRGNGSQISIRGMGGQLGFTTLNGREVATVEEDRNIRYDQFPSELINAAQVYKTPEASLAEGGVSGTVNLQTVKPLDHDERVVSLNLRGSLYELASGIDDADNDGMGSRYSVAYIDQFNDNTLGVAVGLSGQKQPIGTQRAELWNYGDTFHNTQWNDARGKNYNAPWGGSALVRGGTDERLGSMAVITWEPSDSFSLNYDFFYSRLDIDEEQRGFDFQIDSDYARQWEVFDSTPSQYTNVEDGSEDLLSGRVGLSSLRNLNEQFTQTDELMSHGINLEWNTESWIFSTDLSQSSADRSRRWMTVRTVNTSDDLYGTFGATSDDRMTFELDPGISLTDPSQNLVDNIEVRPLAEGEDDIAALALNAEYLIDGSVFSSFAFGTRYSEREKSLDAQIWQQYVSDNAGEAIPSELIEEAGADDYWNGLPQYLTLDRQGIIDHYFGGLANPDVGDNDDLLASWKVTEDITAAYAQLNIDSEVSGIPVSGNLGLRWVRTDTGTHGHRVTPEIWYEEGGEWYSIPAQAQPVRTKNRYTDVLPSLNLNFGITEDSQVRFALAKTIARAPLDFLSPALDLGQDQWGANPGESGSGNPYLEPFRADQADLTYEWYFADDSSLATTLFYKDMESYIARAAGADTVEYEGTEYSVSMPVNGSGGYIRGYELMYQQPLSFLPGFLDGLGVYANYAYTESNIEQGTPLYATPFGLTGLSEHVGTATLWYYRNGFESRFSYSYRSDFQRDVNRVQGEEGVNAAEGYVDLSLSYEATENVKLMFQVQNLTDEPYKVYGLESNNEAHVNKYEEFGRRFTFGVNWKL